MPLHPSKYASMFVGGGPAGTAVLLSAHRDGSLQELLQRGLLIVERGATLGSGQIGSYVINSDSTGATFLDALNAGREPKLRCIMDTPVARRIASAADGAVPLGDVGELMRLIGAAVQSMVEEYPQSAVLLSCSAKSATRLADGSWQLTVADRSGATQQFQAPRLVLATGAAQPGARLQEERLAGERVAKRWGHRLLQSGDVLSQAGLDRVAELLRAQPDPKVAILGGSTSAMAVAHALLHRTSGIPFGPGHITVFHRKPLRVYYTSAEEAIADGYKEFGPDDLCPVTKRVFRFAGLRLDSRELLMQVKGVGGRSPEPRVVLHQLKSHDPEAVARIDAASLVVAAFGYRPNALPLFNRYHRRIPLLAHTTSSASLVDGECRVLRSDGRPIPGVYGIGLAAGYRPSGEFGGEPSFAGQANGLWLWQNGVGSVIANALLAPPAAPGGLPRKLRTTVQSRVPAHSAIDFSAGGLA